MRARLSKRRLKTLARQLRFEALEDRRVLAAGIGVFNPANDTFTLRNELSAGPPTAGEFHYNENGSIAVAGDWNGDGTDDFGLFDPATAAWSLKYGTESGEANAGVFVQGEPGTLPVVGDWNGDGRDDIGTYDPATATWSLRLGAGPGPFDAGVFQFGATKASPVVGDWDGDGVDGVGTLKSGNWLLRQTPDAGPADRQFAFGPTRASALPLSGDWDGDGSDGIGVFDSSTAQWSLRQAASAGPATAGSFTFGSPGSSPIVGDFVADPTADDALATLVLPPINLSLLGLEVRTSPITVTISTESGDGKLVGNLLNSVGSLVDLNSASSALNEVLDSTIGLLNTASLEITGLVSGPLDTAETGSLQILELFVAPVHLDLLGLQVDTSTIRVTITATSGDGLILGNVVTAVANLFNPPLPDQLDIDYLNQTLDDLLVTLNEQLPGVASAAVPAVPFDDGQILNLTVPALDLDLLGLVVETSPITVNAAAETGPGLLLGNVLTTALKTLDATPQNLSELSTNVNEILAKVIGTLNAADLSLLAGAVDALPAALQVLLSPVLTAPADGSVAPILDLLIASPDGTTPPVNVDLLGLEITTSNIEAHVYAETGDGNVLGNLLYNVAHLADPGGPAGLLTLLNVLGSGDLSSPGNITGGSVTPVTLEPSELMTLTINPLEIDLLGVEIRTEPIIVTLSAQEGDGKLLGNLLTTITTLINVDGIANALNNVLGTTVDLLNSASLLVDGVGAGSFDNAPTQVVPILDLYVAPVYLDLLGLIAETEPIHVTITARSGNGLVLGNLLVELANLFNPPLPEKLDIDFINGKLALLVDRLNQQIPLIPPAQSPPVDLADDQFLQLTVPAIDLDLLGLLLQTSPITVNAYAHTGDGLLLGNILTTVLNTLDATPENLTGLSENLNGLLAKVVGVLNAADLILPTGLLGSLPGVLQSLAGPTLVSSDPGARVEILELIVSSGDNAGPPIDVDLLGLEVTTSNIEARLLAETGDGNLLGNLLYNVANLLNPGGAASLLTLLSQLGRLRLDIGGTLDYVENAVAGILSPDAVLSLAGKASFSNGRLIVSITENADVNDRLRIVNQGTGPGQIGASGGNVTFGGTLIGTYTGGIGAKPLTVNLNSKATPSAVEALTRAITFQTLGNAPSLLARNVTFRVLDANGGASNPASVLVRVTDLNDAPVLNNSGSPVLPAIAEDTTNPAGVLIKTLVGDTITDPDANALEGIALIAADGRNGSWQFSLNGTNWQNVGTVAADSVLLLPSNEVAKIRFVPAANFHGNVPFRYRAWDQTEGTAGARINSVGNVGKAKAVSVLQESASITVTPVNDGPVLVTGGTRSPHIDGPALKLDTSATVSDIDSRNFDGGELRVSIGLGAGSGNRLALSGSFSVDSDKNLLYGNQIIGKRVSNGVGTNELVLTFNNKVTPAVAQLLVRSITYRATGGSTGIRTALMTLKDGDGGTSALQTIKLDVQPEWDD